MCAAGFLQRKDMNASDKFHMYLCVRVEKKDIKESERERESESVSVMCLCQRQLLFASHVKSREGATEDTQRTHTHTQTQRQALRHRHSTQIFNDFVTTIFNLTCKLPSSSLTQVSLCNTVTLYRETINVKPNSHKLYHG